MLPSRIPILFRFQIDFERVMRVRKFATQGHPRYDYWVDRFALDYTVNDTLLDDGIWNTYEEEGQQKVRLQFKVQNMDYDKTHINLFRSNLSQL